ncbi:hypothetical protein VVD49_19430 [Uliginosibacterium sp. H3]|uniref:DUF2974 domain-containing protein n=1 Tax=Uliginosibacterium silvisoli TaxID=3114758 RepID=A0ABU6K8L5_9RHOO|nr:hypothetical protein [Uliginosibacterium sp. H3]
MNTLSIAETLKYANLQMAAEALYDSDATVPGVVLMPGKPFAGSIDPKVLMTGNEHTSKFTEVGAKEFSDLWEVVEHKSNTTTGFSGTLFRNRVTGDLVMSIRSTEFIDDVVRDNEATNAMELKATSWALGQLSDMEAWYQHLRRDLGLGNQKIDITGYSLGGYVAAEFNLLHQDEVVAGKIGKVVTFNGAGVGSIDGLASLKGAAGQQKVKDMLTWFTARRSNDADLGAGTLNLFNTDTGKAAYASLRAAERQLAPEATSAQMGSALNAAVDAYFASPPDSGMSQAWQDDRTLLQTAVARAVHLRAYREEVGKLSSGLAAPLDTPAKIPDASIEQERINYQLAVVATSNQFHLAPRGFWQQAFQLVLQGTVQLEPAAINDNLYYVKLIIRIRSGEINRSALLRCAPIDA